MLLAQAGHPERLVLLGVLLTADAGRPHVEQADDGGETRVRSGPPLRQTIRRRRPGVGQPAGEADYPLELLPVALDPPVRRGSGTGAVRRRRCQGLDVAVRPRADPDVGPGRRDGQAVIRSRTSGSVTGWPPAHRYTKRRPRRWRSMPGACQSERRRRGTPRTIPRRAAIDAPDLGQLGPGAPPLGNYGTVRSRTDCVEAPWPVRRAPGRRRSTGGSPACGSGPVRDASIRPGTRPSSRPRWTGWPSWATTG